MSKLDELIRELCPDGVQVFRLEEIAHYAKTRIDCKTINEDNYVGVENLLQNKAGKTKATSVPTTGMVIAYQKNDILIGNIRPYLRKVWLADCEGGTNGDVLTVQIEDTEKVLPQFLYYVLSSEKFFLYDIQNSKGAKMPRGSKDAVMKFEVPLPPPEVQREIVRILDNFTNLTAELTAELTARKTQYSFYREKLLDMTKVKAMMVEIADLGKWSGGKTPSMAEMKYWEGGTIPWVSSKERTIEFLSTHKNSQALLFTQQRCLNYITEQVSTKASTMELYKNNLNNIHANLNVEEIYTQELSIIDKVISEKDFMSALKIINDKGLLPDTKLPNEFGWKKEYYIDYMLKLVSKRDEVGNRLRESMRRYVFEE